MLTANTDQNPHAFQQNSVNMPEVPCSLVVNVSRGDTPILARTLPHIIDTHKVKFSEIVVAVDERPAEGRIAQTSHQYPLKDLYQVLDSIKLQGYSFRQEAVSYDSSDIERVYGKWFGHTLGSYRCAGGTPIYAFLFGIDIARNDFRLHIDSDMLLHDPGPQSWVQEGMRVLRNTPKALFVNQGWKLVGNTQLNTNDDIPGSSLDFTSTFTSRCFLFSLEKLEKSLLPINPTRHSIWKSLIYRLQGRSQYKALEQMITDALYESSYFRCDLAPKWGMSFHCNDKRLFNRVEIEDVIRRVQDGNIPVEHASQFDLQFDLFLTSGSDGNHLRKDDQ